MSEERDVGHHLRSRFPSRLGLALLAPLVGWVAWDWWSSARDGGALLIRLVAADGAEASQQPTDALLLQRIALLMP